MNLPSTPPNEGAVYLLVSAVQRHHLVDGQKAILQLPTQQRSGDSQVANEEPTQSHKGVVDFGRALGIHNPH